MQKDRGCPSRRLIQIPITNLKQRLGNTSLCVRDNDDEDFCTVGYTLN